MIVAYETHHFSDVMPRIVEFIDNSEDLTASIIIIIITITIMIYPDNGGSRTF